MLVVRAAYIIIGCVGVHAYRNRLCVSRQCSSEFLFLETDSCTAVGASLRTEVSDAAGHHHTELETTGPRWGPVAR